MQVNNAGISGGIIDGDALAASGGNKVSFPSLIRFLLFFSQNKSR